MNNNTKRLTTLAMLTGMALVLGITFRFRGIMPMAGFLTYDPKDVIIIIGGFLYGPLSGVLLAFVVAAIEMVTISESGPIGFLMNFLASATLVAPAAFFYSRMRSIKGGVIGLVIGVIASTATMLLWNYTIIPLYTGWPREAVVNIMLPALLPFNLIKGTLNASMAIMLYIPVSTALKAARLHPALGIEAPRRKLNIGLVLVAGFVAISLILVMLALSGMI
ncbi:MAG: ECF transporter S component [Defluviitaleaceae bacterium]|nr:ECF transporter S component [Defluviitaleaceae bacterium]